MIELNSATVKDVVRIVVRKEDCAITLMADERKTDVQDHRFNVCPLAAPNHPCSSTDDRLVVGSPEGVLAVISLLGKIIGHVFVKFDDSCSGENEIYIRQDMNQ